MHGLGIFGVVHQQVVGVFGAGNHGGFYGKRLALRISAHAHKTGGLQSIQGGGFRAHLGGLEHIAKDVCVRAACLGRRHHYHQGGIARGVNQCEPIRIVLHLPAHGRCQRKAEWHVVKIAAPHKALLHAIAKGHALQHFEVTSTALVTVVAFVVLIGQLRDHLQALVVTWMGGEPVTPAGRGAALGLGLVGGKALLVFEHVDDVNHVAWVIAHAG